MHRSRSGCRSLFVQDRDLGIWTPPVGDKVVWFKDPDGNVLSIWPAPCLIITPDVSFPVGYPLLETLFVRLWRCRNSFE
jgi:hypothetical protein